MGSNQSGYTETEIDSIAGWLRGGLSASQIAGRLSVWRGSTVTRNAIVGIVHRNARLRAIGFARYGHGGGGNFGGARQAARAQHPSPRSPSASASPQRGNLSSPPRGEEDVRRRPSSPPGTDKARRACEPLAALGEGPSAVVPLRIVDEIPPSAYDRAARHLPLEALGHAQCRWPVNDAPQGGQHLFCAAPTADERSYCPHHGRRAVGSGTPAERQAPRQLLRLTA
ncbi:hypothetical protein EN851_07650 [Mesorhizobium sp. M8A.F.Ca.ET.208.01.1.1]|uniref:GcrA family cell cycle regulator n=1 Tax=unclassified Mesorhizobium TaxID=325217 RepID=UPI0010939735|nr:MULTISPECIES: GcrA family cell cycle regulator [unclassified Mesorhizobium]TGQ95387.1 hypothetical protein EN851_07650 [Mesorhizobium sp. M8A.F.Ca.ET.208.01.1.1]TGT55878.1 hypothetical protein EN810_07650 [Mesorhizobium sp. M8A.F.Ca.ET.167.01.1.1]